MSRPRVLSAFLAVSCATAMTPLPTAGPAGALTPGARAVAGPTSVAATSNGRSDHATTAAGIASADLSIIAQRPLFNPARRPPETARPEVAAAKPVTRARRPTALPAGLVLVGIVTDRGDRPSALLRLGSEEATKLLSTGSRIEEWTVTEIHQAAIVLESPGSRCEIVVGKPVPSVETCARPNG